MRGSGRDCIALHPQPVPSANMSGEARPYSHWRRREFTLYVQVDGQLNAARIDVDLGGRIPREAGLSCDE